MAKMFISFDEEFALVADTIEKTLRKNSGHRRAIYQAQSDFTIHLTSDWAGGSEKFTPIVYNHDMQMKQLSQSIVSIFKENNLPFAYPNGKNEKLDYQKVDLRLGRKHHDIDQKLWGELIAEGIIMYFNPEYSEHKKTEKEPTVKRSQDKTYYDRSFNNNSTNNSSILFKKK